MKEASDRGASQDSARPRIVDFSTHLSGPLASHLLHELGAQIVKVENPRGGDGNRRMGPFIEGQGLFHVTLNPGTRSVAVSTRSPHWGRVVDACVSWADAVIVGARPQDAVKRGLDFASLRRSSEEIVYCLISGFGETGPLAHYPAHGQTVDALAGLLPVDWVEGMPETPAGWRSAGTSLAGIFGALGVMAGLYRREIEGGAQYVSTSLWENAMWWNWRDSAMLQNTGESWNEYKDLGSRYRMYPTSDGRAILVCPIERRFWERFCDVVSLPADWKDHGSWEQSRMDFGLGDEYRQEEELIAERMRERSLADWRAVIDEAEIPFAPVLTLEEALTERHAGIMGIMSDTEVGERPVKVPRSPLRVGLDPNRAEHPGGRLAPPPEIGQHTGSFLQELGLEDIVGDLDDGESHP